MSIHSFVQKYGSEPTRPIEQLARRWEAERKVRDFLGTPVMAGMTIADLAIGDGLGDTFSPGMREAFQSLMDERADTRHEVEALIREKLELGGKSVQGLMNKIQGQIGEDSFVRAAGGRAGLADLAESGSQRDWDVWVRGGHSGSLRHVQVKVYEDSDAAIAKLESLQARIEQGLVMGESGRTLDAVDFAVNLEIFEEVKEHAAGLDYPGEVLCLGQSRTDIREMLEGDFGNVAEPFEHFFGELLGDLAPVAIVQAMAHGYMLLTRSRDARGAGADYAGSVSVTAGGLVAAHITEQVIDQILAALDYGDGASVLAVEPSSAAALAAGMLTRALLKRVILGRLRFATWLQSQNTALVGLAEKVGTFPTGIVPA
jgi:hypothetical protein